MGMEYVGTHSMTKDVMAYFNAYRPSTHTLRECDPRGVGTVVYIERCPTV